MQNKEKKKKILEWLNKKLPSRKQFSRLVLVFTVSFFLFNLPSLWNVVQQNKEVLLILLPFFLGFIFLYLIKKNDFVNLLTTSSIVLAILFFLISISVGTDKKIETIKGVNTHNCFIVADNIIAGLKGKDLTRSFTFGYYTTNIYQDNLGFIYSQFGASKFAKYSQFLYDADYSNGLVTLIPLTTNPYNKEIYNQQVLSFAKKIQNDFCMKI